MKPKTSERQVRAVGQAVIILGLAALALGCESTGGPSGAAKEPTHWSSTSYSPRWPAPADLPSYGVAGPSSIKVAVYGMHNTVQRPGYYYLPLGAVVEDAIAAAGGLSKYTWWTHSGLQRPKPNGPWEIIRFTWDRAGEEKIVLRDGDQLYFGHEVY